MVGGDIFLLVGVVRCILQIDDKLRDLLRLPMEAGSRWSASISRTPAKKAAHVDDIRPLHSG